MERLAFLASPSEPPSRISQIGLGMEPFKNNISPELVSVIAFHLDKHLTGFDRPDFETGILERLDALEHKE